MPYISPILQRPSGTVRNPRTGTVPTNINNTAEGYTREVQPDELAENRLTDMVNGDSRYIQAARGRGAAQADALGVGHSSLFASAAEAAAIDAAAPIATHDADAYGNAARENLDSLRQQRISEEGNDSALSQTIINTTTQAGIAEADRLSREREAALDREYNSTERERERTADQTFRRDEAERDFNRNAGLQREQWRFNSREGYRQAQREVTTGLMSFFVQNPEYFGDPQSMLGFLDMMGPELDRIWGGNPYDEEPGP